MIGTKTRNTIIAAVASLSFAGAAVAPAVSQAQYHNYCVAGHCVTHANYTYENPCAGKSATAMIESIEEAGQKMRTEAEQERKQEEEERKKQKGEEKEGEVHQSEIEKSFYGCSVGAVKGSPEATPPPVRTMPVISSPSSAVL